MAAPAVDVFFILSGLVIVQSLASFGYRPRPFLIARVARIFPVFLVVFAVRVAVQPLASGFSLMPWIDQNSTLRYLWPSGWPNDWAVGIVTHLTMTHGLFPDGVLPHLWLGFLGAAWSLSTEWQFYLLAVADRRARSGCARSPGCSWRCPAWPIAWHVVAPETGSSAARSCRTRRSTSPSASPARSWCGKAPRASAPTLPCSASRWWCVSSMAASTSCCRRWSGRCVWPHSLYLTGIVRSRDPAGDGVVGCRDLSSMAARSPGRDSLRSRPLGLAGRRVVRHLSGQRAGAEGAWPGACAHRARRWEAVHRALAAGLLRPVRVSSMEHPRPS